MGRTPTGYVRRQPSGRWKARIKVQGRELTSTFDRKSEADRWLVSQAATALARTSGHWTERTPDSGVLFQEYAEEWLKRMKKDHKARTQSLYRKLLDRHLIPAFGLAQIGLIEPDDVNAWFYGEWTSQTTRGQAYSLLRTIMNAAVRESRIRANPCMIAKARTLKKRDVAIATPEEIAALAELVPARYRLLVLLGGWSGLRYSELTALQRRDVLRNPLRLKSRPPVHLIDGTWVIDERHKSRAGDRTVHLPPSLEADIDRHLSEYVEDRPDALLFSTSGGRYLPRSNWATMFMRARRAIGRDDLRFHDLRHTQATLAAQAGATQAELMARLGHASNTAVMLYQHAQASRDESLARLMDQIKTSATGDSHAPQSP